MELSLHEPPADQISWVIPRIELVETRVNVLVLNDWQTCLYAIQLQREVTALRALAHAGIQHAHTLTAEIERQRRQLAHLRDELREQRRIAA